MVDIPQDSSTTAGISVGGSAVGSLETIGDRDWWRIELTAGQAITVSLSGITLEDPYVRILDAAGNVIYENDDIQLGVNRDSQVSFTATRSGTYYIEVGAWNDGYAGDYILAVSTYVPPPLWTNDQVADQLVSGYWAGDTHRFNVDQGGTITVNLTALTPAGQALAREALDTWSDIIGIDFAEVATGGQITFDDDEEGAFSDGTWSNGIITSTRVNVSTDWLNNYGTSLSSYSFQTYIHEIGHALGLGHAGNYNETARYPYDVLYENDSWAVTVMSYFDQRENTYFGGQGFTVNFLGTPMVADIIAMSELYGLATTTRTGNTTYGFNSNAGRAVYDASLYPSVAYTVFDNGGTDTLNYASGLGNQLINLNPETFSSVNGRVGNVSIARGTIIENAIGGPGGDQLIGNSVNNVLTGNGGLDVLTGNGGNDVLIGGSGNDQLNGGAGSDTFRGTASELNGDTIADFGSVDSIVITNANLATFSFSLSGNTLTFTGGSLTLAGGVDGKIVAQAAAGGGVQLMLQRTSSGNLGPTDFNGDGRDDILWRHEGGEVVEWLGQPGGDFASNPAAYSFVHPSWEVVGTGDFNGDGRGDVFWRHEGGEVVEWLGQANGSFVGNAAAYSFVHPSWSVAGTGDFNGDGRDDVLWRNDTGEFVEWIGQANGGFVGNAAAFSFVHPNWHVAGTGDFNGDGRDDVLWRNGTGEFVEWLGQANGAFVGNAAASSFVHSNWQLAGTGDFNGDGRDDILWHNQSGEFIEWLGQADGSFLGNSAFYEFVHPSWDVAGTGDFDGDGRDDILWRHEGGEVVVWLGQANGGFIDNPAAYDFVHPSWQVQPVEDIIGL